MGSTGVGVFGPLILLANGSAHAPPYWFIQNPRDAYHITMLVSASVARTDALRDRSWTTRGTSWAPGLGPFHAGLRGKEGRGGGHAATRAQIMYTLTRWSAENSMKHRRFEMQKLLFWTYASCVRFCKFPPTLQTKLQNCFVSAHPHEFPILVLLLFSRGVPFAGVRNLPASQARPGRLLPRGHAVRHLRLVFSRDALVCGDTERHRSHASGRCNAGPVPDAGARSGREGRARNLIIGQFMYRSVTGGLHPQHCCLGVEVKTVAIESGVDRQACARSIEKRTHYSHPSRTRARAPCPCIQTDLHPRELRRRYRVRGTPVWRAGSHAHASLAVLRRPRGNAGASTHLRASDAIHGPAQCQGRHGWRWGGKEGGGVCET